GRYLSVFFLLTFALGIAFQTPVVVFYLIRWGVLDVESLRHQRKGVVLGAFVLAAVITPPDPVTQIMMAVTLIVLYDLGGLLAAPSRTTIVGFSKFAGMLVLAGLVLVGWFRLWPLGEVRALQGTVRVGDEQVARGATAGVTRGSLCSTGSDGAAALSLRAAGPPQVYVAPGTRLQVHAATSLSLYEGSILVSAPAPEVDLTVRTAPATAVVRRGRAELNAPGKDTLTVTVFGGEVDVQSGGQTRVIAAGQTATFRRGGEPADISAAEKRWQELIEAAPGGESGS
ncbi:MAG: twin-arginine translocase subunit TatC, partial [Planctomycetota bacterium]